MQLSLPHSLVKLCQDTQIRAGHPAITGRGQGNQLRVLHLLDCETAIVFADDDCCTIILLCVTYVVEVNEVSELRRPLCCDSGNSCLTLTRNCLRGTTLKTDSHCTIFRGCMSGQSTVKANQDEVRTAFVKLQQEL